MFLFHQMTNTYRKSHIKDAFVRTVIDGFSSGSLRVFFKVIFDRSLLPKSVTPS